MSSKYTTAILTGFFLTVSVLAVFRVISPNPKHDERVQEQATQLEIGRIALQRLHLQRNADLWFYGSLGVVSCVGLAVLIVSSGLHRAHVKRAQVHTYKIGDSEVVIHERDLSLAAPVALGLMNAEQLKQMNGGMEKAFELSCRMAEIQSQQIRALMHGSRALKALPEKTDAEEAHFSGQIPTFRELLNSGELARGKPMILGYINGVPRRGSFLDIYSAAVAGESGSGKTSTMLFLIGGGLISQPIRFEGIDPHYPHPKSLAYKTKALWDKGLISMASDKDGTLQTLQRIEQTIDRRIAQHDTSTIPVVLVIDEIAFLSTTSLGPHLAHTMERISTEGRKCEVYMLASSQTWLADRTGGSSVVRDTLTSSYIHRMKPKQANLLLQDKSETEKVKRYCRKAGEVLLCSVQNDSAIARIPLTTEDDMNLVIDLVNRQRVDQVVDCSSQHTGLVKSGVVDLVDQVSKTLQNNGDFSALVQSTGLDKAYVSRILNHKQTMSRNAEDRLRMWMKNH